MMNNMRDQVTTVGNILWKSIFRPPTSDIEIYPVIVWNKSEDTWKIGTALWERSKTRPKDLTSGWAIYNYDSNWRVVAWGMSSVPDSVITKFPIPAVGDWADWAEE